MKGELETEQRLQHIDPPAPWAIAVRLFCSPGLLNRGSGSPASLLRAGFHSSIWNTDFKLWTPTAWLPVSPGLYHCFTPTQFNPSTVKVIPLISSTGCTCYLHRCISLLTAWPGRRSICNRISALPTASDPQLWTQLPPKWTKWLLIIPFTNDIRTCLYLSSVTSSLWNPPAIPITQIFSWRSVNFSTFYLPSQISKHPVNLITYHMWTHMTFVTHTSIQSF